MSSAAHSLLHLGRHDPLRRFTPTPHGTQFSICARTIRFETNSPQLLEQAARLIERYSATPLGEQQFVWRVVVQRSPEAIPPWPSRFAFSDGYLRYVHFGQNSFVAVDLKHRRAVGFLCQGLADDPLGFMSPFLDNLFCMTAAGIGLTTVSAACVGSANRALIVIGPPNNGKTTASYLAAKKGLRFLADRSVFLETNHGRLGGWGDFWPAAFRAETLEFLPELHDVTSPLRYQDFIFHYFDKSVFQQPRAEPLIPVCCIFLQRGVTAEPRLTSIPKTDLRTRLSALAAFQEDPRFRGQQAAVFNALAKLPAYNLAYDEDPATAAEFFPRLLVSS